MCIRDRKEVNQVETEIDETSKKARSTTDQLAETRTQSLVSQQALEALKTDIASRDLDVERLRSETDANQATQIREFEGDGDRQYLTGLRVAGKHIVIALDTSTSMLDETIVNILIRRNKSEEEIKESPKWQRAIKTVEWIGAQLPLDSEFQVFGFNEQASSLANTTNSQWISM